MRYYSEAKFTQWPSVERVARNDLSRIIGLVPLVGYLILFNDELVDLASFKTIAGVIDEKNTPFILSGLTKLRLVFFGSLLVLFSNLIFIVFSPKALQASKGDLEFSVRVRDSYSVAEIVGMEELIYSDSWKPRTPIFWDRDGSIRNKKHLISGYKSNARAGMFSKHGDYINFLAREWWAGEMHSFWLARFASLAFGIIGYFLLALPTFDISQAVLLDVLAGVRAYFAQG